jgi:hypothetical protein
MITGKTPNAAPKTEHTGFCAHRPTRMEQDQGDRRRVNDKALRNPS